MFCQFSTKRRSRLLWYVFISFTFILTVFKFTLHCLQVSLLGVLVSEVLVHFLVTIRSRTTTCMSAAALFALLSSSFWLQMHQFVFGMSKLLFSSGCIVVGLWIISFKCSFVHVYLRLFGNVSLVLCLSYRIQEEMDRLSRPDCAGRQQSQPWC